MVAADTQMILVAMTMKVVVMEGVTAPLVMMVPLAMGLGGHHSTYVPPELFIHSCLNNEPSCIRLGMHQSITRQITVTLTMLLQHLMPPLPSRCPIHLSHHQCQH